MLAIEKWGEGKYKPMVMLAQVVAVSAESCFELIKLVRTKPPLSLPVAGNIDFDEWRRLYRRHTPVQAAMLQALVEPDDPDGVEQATLQIRPMRAELRNGLREAVRYALTQGLTSRELRQSERLVERYYRRTHLPMVASMIRDEDESTTGAGWVGRADFMFFVTVALPCWHLFNTSPWVLYREATSGNTNALERLLRVDPLLVGDTRIDAQLQRIFKRNRELHAGLMKAAGEGVKKEIHLSDVKFLLGGLLLRISAEWEEWLNGERLIEEIDHRVPSHKRAGFVKWAKEVRKHAARHPSHCRLTAPDVRGLFDAIAIDRGLGPIDRDFIGETASVSKRLRRNAVLWPSLWKADKKRAA